METPKRSDLKSRFIPSVADGTAMERQVFLLVVLSNRLFHTYISTFLKWKYFKKEVSKKFQRTFHEHSFQDFSLRINFRKKN